MERGHISFGVVNSTLALVKGVMGGSGGSGGWEVCISRSVRTQVGRGRRRDAFSILVYARKYILFIWLGQEDCRHTF